MRKLTIALFAAALVAALAPVGQTGTPAPLALVRVHYHSVDEAAFLLSNFDETHNHGADEIELLLWPGDRAELDSLGFEYEVVTPDIFARDLSLLGGPQPVIELPGPDRSDYRRLADYNTEMADLAEKNPGLVELFEMKRPSLEGRTVYGLEIAAKVKDKDGRPIFYMDALHHAREWPASEYTMNYAHYLVEGFGKNAKITSLLKKARVIIVPIVNVDGFNYSRESVQSLNQTVGDLTSNTALGNGFEGYWRKNRRSLTGVTVPGAQVNPDAYGVDPNRNYAYLWGDSNGGSSSTQVDQTYRGEAPFSEPEVANVRDIVLSRPVTGIITNHTYQNTVLRAGGGDAPEDGILVSIGQKMADLLGYRNVPSVGYPTTGTTDDWAYAAMAALGFTIEHGDAGFHPAYAVGVGERNDQAMEAFTVMLDASADPKYHSVITGKVAGGKAKLILTKTFKTKLSPGNPTGEDSIKEEQVMKLTTEKDGSFEWHVSPSSRPYEKKAEDYRLLVKQGNKVDSLRVRVDRGERVNLGRIKLGGAILVGIDVAEGGVIGEDGGPPPPPFRGAR